MKQVLQSLRNGQTELWDVPCPQVKPGQVLIRSHASLISPGTERMLIEFGKANLLNKARQQPDKVRQVLAKIATDGLWSTWEAVHSKLDQPLPMGYANVGTVREVGTGVTEFRPGDRVVSNGPHAQVVCVPQNLCCAVPEVVDDDAAAFTVLGAVALQGVRLGEPTLGETFAVFGLGLVGLLAVQLLRAHGCRVIGVDFDRQRLELARQFGATTVDLSRGDDAVAAGMRFTRDRGVDGVLIAAATDSRDPILQAAHLCRKRGRVVLVGVVGMELPRTEFYEKELSFQVSCSYGPGRYDPAYEDRGGDYPLPYVRWTAGRNFEAFLDLLAERRIDVEPLITHRVPFDSAEAAYARITNGESSLGLLLKYPTQIECPEITLRATRIANERKTGPKRVAWAPRIGFVGAGEFALRTLLPAFHHGGAKLTVIASASGRTAAHAARKFCAAAAGSDVDAVLSDPSVDAVVIATRHDTHADLVCRALTAGKHVFVEKPLALSHRELEDVERSYHAAKEPGAWPVLMVGYNRRFSPLVRQMAKLLNRIDEPKSFVMTVNAGAIPAEHWTQDARVGGGRIVGEACHFIDLLRFLCGRPIDSVQTTYLGESTDSATATLRFTDGSMGTVHYLAGGHRAFPKERLEVFCAGRVLQLDNFRRLRGFGWPGFRGVSLWRQDKGHRAEAREFLHAVQSGGAPPIALEELLEVSRVSFEIASKASDVSRIDSPEPYAATAKAA